MNEVDVSVVMSVFNGAAALPTTIASVLGQQGCALEFIIVNDGSTDETGAILAQWQARDPRLRVIEQANTGLTRALARGCAQARGEFIARQDCGDVSLPGRLQEQQDFLRSHPEAVMVACGVEFIGPGNEPLFTVASDGAALHDGLSVLDARRIKGPPHHGGTMFRRAAYLEVGGYRTAFAVAQDLDLWLRLRETGLCLGVPQPGYVARLEAGSISAIRRDEQFALAAIAVESARRRSAGAGDADLLASLDAAARPRRGAASRWERACFSYFIGSCLGESDPAAARRYFLQSFREHPLMMKGLIRYVLG